MDGNNKRNLLKKIQPKDLPATPWNCGEDVPMSFSKEEKKTMQFKTVKKNYKIGSITKVMYEQLMASIRNN